MSGPWAALFQTEIGKAGLEVLHKLGGAGYPSYFVGGCVRDTLLGRNVKDIDIATAATPAEVLTLFPDAVPTGLQHGTVTVFAGAHPFEVTTFRTESEYGDGRRPDTVSFIDSIEGDLERRDFTMNAMALSGSGQFVDPYGGRDDLARGVLRCVGEPALRFAEDSLRMLRCVRFAAEYNLTVDKLTWQEVAAGAPSLSRIAMERVRDELERMLSGASPYRAIQLLTESGLLRWTKTRLRLPRELGVSHEHRDPLKELERLPEPVQRWALWFHRMQIGPAAARGTITQLRGSKAFGEETEQILGVFQMLSSAPAEHAAFAWKTAVLGFGREIVFLWLPIADRLQHYADYSWTSAYADNGVKWLLDMPVTSLQELSVDGRALMSALNRKGGPWLSHMLRRLLFEAALNRIRNDPQALLERAAEMAIEEGDSHH